MKYITFLTKNQNELGESIATATYIEKKSQFICYIFSVQTVAESTLALHKIQKKHPDARHIVYLYSILENNLPVIKFSDDGEPLGTGTKAILGMVQKEKLTNFCMIIVRYFGGILLGAAPLSRAYLTAFKQAAVLCQKKEIYQYIPYCVTLSYPSYTKLESSLQQWKREEKIQIQNIIFQEEVTLQLTIQEEYDAEIVAVIEGR